MSKHPEFLRGLEALPFRGGSVALIGSPTAVAIDPTPVMLEAYSAWLSFELRYLNATIFPRTRRGDVSLRIPMDNAGARFHQTSVGGFSAGGGAEAWRKVGLAAQRRAPLVLSAVGCGWSGDRSFA